MNDARLYSAAAVALRIEEEHECIPLKCFSKHIGCSLTDSEEVLKKACAYLMNLSIENGLDHGKGWQIINPVISVFKLPDKTINIIWSEDVSKTVLRKIILKNIEDKINNAF